ncbi:hypothetical protein AOZ06_04765 [Kibdelosporangium phytohabitans]|uniref:Uncharacterized protein n=1 Tax=Kibdelosporangium phytohabitans TaxID=860235 RepID=A0A0N9HSZ5_9PSEU|nr:hypothetical protein AOZ06_04765 [Kibdelosporangium phytohabitans]
MVGDPRIDCLREITGTDIWVGDDSVFSHPRNQLATLFYTMLLKDITTGDYAASDDDRNHIRELLAHKDFVPVIHGPCLVIGVNHHGDTAPLSENFRHWFEKFLNRVSTERNPVIRRALAAATGVPPALVDNIITFDA